MNILVEFGNSKVVLALTDPAKLDETLLSKFPQLEDKAHKLLIYSHLFEEYVDLESSSDVQDKSRLKIVTLGGGKKSYFCLIKPTGRQFLGPTESMAQHEIILSFIKYLLT